MPKFPSPRIVLREHADGSHVLRTKNLGHLRTILGRGVLNAFLRAFVQADRIESLIAFEHLTQERHRAGIEQAKRDHLTFLFFIMGTMFELSKVLSQLKGLLVKQRVISPAEWDQFLPGWDERWRSDEACALFRNKLSFHVDEATVEAGLDRIVEKNIAEVFTAGRHLLCPVCRIVLDPPQIAG